MAAATSLMRAQQLVLAAVEDELRPFGLTFASYEALMLLSFARRGELPLGKMSERLMVHPASITNTVDRLEERGLVARRRDDDDKRRILAAITPAGRRVAAEATEPLNKVQFGLAMLDRGRRRHDQRRAASGAPGGRRRRRRRPRPLAKRLTSN